MAFRLSSHLHKNRHGVFGFRVYAPKDLQAVLPFTEHRLSLRTKCPQVARRLAYSLASLLYQRLRRLRLMGQDQQQKQGANLPAELAAERDSMLAEMAVHHSLQADFDAERHALEARFRALITYQGEHGCGPEMKIPAALRAIMGDQGPEDEGLSAFEAALDQLLTQLNELKARENQLLEKMAVLKGRSDEWRLKVDHIEELANAHSRFEVEKAGMADMARRLFGATGSATPSPTVSPEEAEQADIERTLNLQGLDIEGGKMLVSEMFSRYCAEHRTIWKSWADRVRRDYEPARNRLIAVIGGDLAIERLKVSHARLFAEDVLREGEEKKSKPGTMSKKMEFMRAVFNWAKTKALLLDITGPLTMEAEAESYEAFTDDELRTLFESPRYAHNGFARASEFWLPLLGLYTAGRIDELASVKVAEVRQEKGVPGILLSPGGAKTGKNDHSKRFVPLHPALIACGFVEFVSLIKSEGHTDLFPCLPSAKRDGKGKGASRDFQKLRISLGIGSAEGEGRGTKVFHSFRATLTTAMQNWAAAGLMDTLLRWKMEPEVEYGNETAVQPGVQA